MNEQDQRRTSDMEDSTSMTIEFLRARLLSERSVSRTARQRADELTARVAELEEQMKIVSLQRKKAEKATADVLAILENHGISDDSDEFDSSSDQEGVPHVSNVGNYFKKDEELSISSKARSDDVEKISGSDGESCPLPGRSLSWKSSKSNSNSLENKNMDSHSRRRSGFSSTGSSSSTNRQGKSCRKIRRRELRPAADDLRNEGAALSPEPTRAVSSPESVAILLETATKHLSESGEEREDKVVEEVTGSLTTGYQFSREQDGDGDMEKALEHQAELIGRFEAEEKAQREWEEKFREIKGNSPDSCEPENQSDVTEERYEIKARARMPVATNVSQDTCKKSEVKDHFKDDFVGVYSDGLQFPVQVDTVQDGRSEEKVAEEYPAPEFAFSLDKGNNHVQENAERHSHHQPVHSFHHPPGAYEPCPDESVQKLSHSSESRLTSSSGNSGSRKEKYALVPHNPPKELEGVLDALQRAKLSLQLKLGKSSFPVGGSAGNAFQESGSLQSAYGISVPARKPVSVLEVPIGSAGLFRLPTDFQPEATAPQSTVLGPSYRLNAANYYPDLGSTAVAVGGNRFNPGPRLTNHFTEYGGASAVNSQLSRTPYVEAQSSACGSERFATHSNTDGSLSFPRYSQFRDSPYSESSAVLLPAQMTFAGQYYTDASKSPSSRCHPPAYSSSPDTASSEGFPEKLWRRTSKMCSDNFSFHDSKIHRNY